MSGVKYHPYFLDKPYVCAAPLTSLRFDFGGRMTVCCNNLVYTLGNYPTTSPMEAWFGEKIKKIREALSKFDFSLGCTDCEKQIVAGNLRNSILYHHETLFPNTKKLTQKLFPSHLVFQLHNACNYECIMCSGQYSSSIQKNRDKETPSKNSYDDVFVEKIKPFLERAVMIEFLGGEPFLMPINFKLWESIGELNPTAAVNIITNGSIFNKKVVDILSKMPNSAVHISIDSLNEETYSYIRRRGHLPTVLNNIEEFTKLKKLKSLSVCPMIQNVYEIPDLIEFCAARGIGLFFNNVRGLGSDTNKMYANLYENGTIISDKHKTLSEDPIKEFRLWTLPKEEKEKIKNFLLSKTYPHEFQEKVEGFVGYLMNYTWHYDPITKE
jgi:MoaA/NifB/PqqE/SkfB family radical SAM enzyme